MGKRHTLVLLSVAALTMVWLLAGALSHARGATPFGAGAAAWLLALVAFRLGQRRVLYAFVYVLLLASVATLSFETLLHLRPQILRGNIANVAYSGYHWHKGGVYDLDLHRAIVLRPSVSRRMYWNGHWWWHETNADGYRGPRLERADVVVIGDSMIYGHGVKQPDTVAARLAARTGLAVANLGQQGTGQLQSLLTLRSHGRRLQPKTVFACVHFTDGEDSLTYYPPSELERFVAAPGEDAPAPLVREEYRPPRFWDPQHLFSDHLALPLRCSGILGTLLRDIRRRGSPQATAPHRDPLVPTPDEMAAPFLPLHPDAPADVRLCWHAQEQAIAEMDRFSRSIGARLVLFDIGYPRAFTAAIEALAQRLGVEYNPAGRVALGRCLAGEIVYLADDGHWTGTGAEIVADELARATGRAAGNGE